MLMFLSRYDTRALELLASFNFSLPASRRKHASKVSPYARRAHLPYHYAKIFALSKIFECVYYTKSIYIGSTKKMGQYLAVSRCFIHRGRAIPIKSDSDDNAFPTFKSKISSMNVFKESNSFSTRTAPSSRTSSNLLNTVVHRSVGCPVLLSTLYNRVNSALFFRRRETKRYAFLLYNTVYGICSQYGFPLSICTGKIAYPYRAKLR